MSKKDNKTTKNKAKKALFSKRTLAAGFTNPSPVFIMPESKTISSIHMRNNGDGTVTMYNTAKNEKVTWGRAELAAMFISAAAGEHHKALHAE